MKILRFVAFKPSRQYIAQITFQNIRFHQIISSPVVWNVEKEYLTQLQCT